MILMTLAAWLILILIFALVILPVAVYLSARMGAFGFFRGREDAEERNRQFNVENSNHEPLPRRAKNGK